MLRSALCFFACLPFGIAPSAEAAQEKWLPPEITIHETPAGPVYVDAATKFTLYVTRRDLKTPGQSSCIDACTKNWLPVLAGANSRPKGEWSLVERPDGTRQWAFKGRLLYRYAHEVKPGVAWGAGNGTWQYATTDWRYIDARPTGQGAKFPPRVPVEAKLVSAPPGIKGHEMPAGPPVYTDHRGFSLYMQPRKCSGECLAGRIPARASAIASNAGDWTIVEKINGVRQWAYKGVPLFTCDHDANPGDLNCETKDWQSIRIQAANIIETPIGRQN